MSVITITVPGLAPHDALMLAAELNDHLYKRDLDAIVMTGGELVALTREQRVAAIVGLDQVLGVGEPVDARHLRDVRTARAALRESL